ncbi:MAG TPA: hypothetical protein VF111_00075 [Thermoanaerobaculia bacterium]
MIRSAVRLVLVSTVVLLALTACGNREQKAGSAATETIAPAPAQPEETGTDAMTQTVDIESGRSEAEGGGLTSPNPPVVVPGARPSSTDTAATSTAATTTTTTTTTTAAPPPPTTTTR